MSKELSKAIDEFYEAFGKAYDLRIEVLSILESEYGVDPYDYAEELEDENAWVYGLDMDFIERKIEEAQHE